MPRRDSTHPPRKQDRDAVPRDRDQDPVVTSPPVTEKDIERVRELDRKYDWKRFRDKP